MRRVAAALVLLFAHTAALGSPTDPCSPTSTVTDARVSIAISDGRTSFREGEIIPLVLSFTSTIDKRYWADNRNYDRSGRLNIETYCVEPDARDLEAGTDFACSEHGKARSSIPIPAHLCRPISGSYREEERPVDLADTLRRTRRRWSDADNSQIVRKPEVILLKLALIGLRPAVRRSMPLALLGLLARDSPLPMERDA